MVKIEIGMFKNNIEEIECQYENSLQKVFRGLLEVVVAKLETVKQVEHFQTKQIQPSGKVLYFMS